MEGKNRVVPVEVCAECAERRNHGCKAVLNAQKSAEAIVPFGKNLKGRVEPIQDGVSEGRRTAWLNHYAIASMKQRMAQWDEWLRHRIRAYIWKQWKKPKTKLRNLMKLKIPEYFARMAAYSRHGYWFTVETGAVKRAITNERFTRAGFFELSPAYESIWSACIGHAVYRTVRTVR